MEKLKEKFAVLPPEINRVDCCVEGTQGTYKVYWSMEQPGTPCLLALFRYEEMVGEAVEVRGTSGTVSGEVSDTAQYYVGIAAKDNPGIYNKTAVFSCNPLKLNRAIVPGDGSVDLDYEFTGMETDTVQAVFTNEENHISKTVRLLPYAHRIFLKDHGLFSDLEYRMSLKAENGQGKTKAVFLPKGEDCEICFTAPLCLEMRAQRGEDGKLEYTLALEEGFWSGGSLWIELRVLGQRVYERMGIAAGEDNQYHFTVPESVFAAGSYDTMYLYFWIEKGRTLSKQSFPVRFLLPAPVVTGSRYIDQETMEAEFMGECSFPHKILMRELSGAEMTLLPVMEEDKRETVRIPVKDGGEVLFSYQSGLFTGERSRAYSRVRPAYYLLGKELPFLVYSDTPLYKQDEPIIVPLPQGAGMAWQETGENYIRISGQVTGYCLELAKEVWRIADEGIRDAVKEEYETFIKKAEELFTPAQSRLVRGLVEKYLPQSLEEVLYYQGHYRENFVELFPGLELRADFETYQYVGDTSAACYLNGYTGTGRITAPVSFKKGRLCLDAFLALLSEGRYVEDPQQPTGKSVACAQGGGGLADLSANAVSREYMAVCYPEKFPSFRREGVPEVCKNPAVLGASTYQKLQESAAVFQRTGLPADETSVLYLRGRTQITPCVPVILNGHLEKLPLGSTLEDGLATQGWAKLPEHMRIVVKRQGLPVYLFTEAPGWESQFYLYPGDEISWKQVM